MKPSIVNAGADAVIVYFSDEISLAANQRVLQLDAAWQTVIWRYRDRACVLVADGLLRYHASLDTDARGAVKAIIESLPALDERDAAQGQTHVIPVYYDETVGLI